MAIEHKFCFVCGKPLRMLYPGNDPENGPATPRCPGFEHPTVEEYALSEFSDDHAMMVLENLCTDPNIHEHHFFEEVPKDIVDSARAVLAYLKIDPEINNDEEGVGDEAR